MQIENSGCWCVQSRWNAAALIRAAGSHVYANSNRRREFESETLWACVALVALALPVRGRTQASASAEPWYISAAAIHRVMLKPHGQYWRFEHLAMDPEDAKQQMLEWKSQGMTTLEIFAPEEGGNSFDGLDAKGSIST